jgi:O-antigen biosynthesis protein
MVGIENDVVQAYRDGQQKDDRWAFNTSWDFGFSQARTELVGAMDIKEGMDILDIGCANGTTLKYIKDNNSGVSLCGVEPCKRLAKQAKQYAKVHNCTVEKFLKRHRHKYDIIIMADVIEHLLDPWTVVRDMGKLLKTGGYIIASIPNVLNCTVIINLFKYGTFGYHSCDIVNKEHIRFFSSIDMMELFRIAGLKPELLGGIAANYQPGILEQAKAFTKIYNRRDYNIDSYQLALKAHKI